MSLKKTAPAVRSSATPAVESLHPSNTIGSTSPNTTVANGLYIGDFPPEPGQFLPPTPSPSLYNFVCPLWGVQKQKDGAFMVVDPAATLLLGEIVSHDNGLVAHCDTEERAHSVAEALNRKIAWGVGRFLGRTGEDADWYSLLSPTKLRYDAAKLTDVIYCFTEEEAKKIQGLLNATSSSSTKANDVTSVKSDARIHLDHFNKVVKNLAGRILTIVDASFSQEVQRKAVVSLVKKEARQTLSEMFRYVVLRGNGGEESSDTEIDLSD
jgi:hypothetical protein